MDNFAQYSTLNAANYPEKTWLIERVPSTGSRRSMTWREFNNQTNRVANYLRDVLSVKKDDSILHLQMNSLEWMTTYFGALKLGARVVPLNFRFSSPDIKHAADITKPPVFIFDSKFLPLIRPIQNEMPSIRHYVQIGENCPEDLIDFREMPEHENEAEALVDVNPEDDAVYMFTSGTTGDPKPVIHTHKSLLYTGLANSISFNVGHSSVEMGAFPLYHAGILFLNGFPVYIAGGTFVLQTELGKPQWFLECLSEEKVTHSYSAVTPMLDVISAVKTGKIDPENYDFSNLRMLMIGAQPVPMSVFQDLKRLLNFKMGNVYGISEFGGGGATYLFDEDLFDKPGSIGRATCFTETRIVDNNDNAVQTGEVGELVLKGPRCMKGYLNNQELTSAAIENGWFHTGDLLYMDQDGYLFYSDRKKDLIIRGGENIFPAEIEDVLHQNPKIEDAAVVGYPNPRYGEIALAVVQLMSGEQSTQQEIIEFCGEQGLAKYKWPEKVVFASVPRNPTGKLQKTVLRDKYCG